MPSHPDNSTQGQVPPAPSGQALSSSNQVVPPTAMGSNHQQLPHQKQVNQTQPSIQRIVQQNRPVNSELPNKSQNDTAQAEQQTVNNTSQVGVSVATPQSCADSSAAVPASSAVASQWKSSEPVYDSNIPNSNIQAGSVGSPSLTNSSGTEPIQPPIGQGLGPRKLSGSLPSHGHNVGTQWQQSQPPPQSLPPMSQQYVQQEQQQLHPEKKSPQNQLPLQTQPQQQIQHLQAEQGMYLRPANSKAE